MTNILLKDPGFVPNEADNMSCSLACMQMAMKTGGAAPVYTFAEMNAFLHRRSGNFTWNWALAALMAEGPFDVQFISTFSLSRFEREGMTYVAERYALSWDSARVVKSRMNTLYEQHLAAQFLKENKLQIVSRVPRVTDMKRLLKEGWYHIPLVDIYTLHNKPNPKQRHGGHVVFVYGCDETGVTFHDPGLPPKPARHMPWPAFDIAWSRPNAYVRELLCFRPR